MLTDLIISNYTIVDKLELEISSGLTVITGETGAGKSIALDALGLCLGDRADATAVRSNCEKAEISATFSVENIPEAKRWLVARDLALGNECMLRRVITQEGRSKAYINGTPSTLRDCSELGTLLIDIHSQHSHQSLLRKDTQRYLLDNFGGNTKLAKKVEDVASNWLRLKKERDILVGAHDELASRVQLLAYQVDELDSLQLADGELELLELDAKRFENALQILESGHESVSLIEKSEDAVSKALSLISSKIHDQPTLDNARELMDNARISLSEAGLDIKAYIEEVEVNPSKQAVTENRLEKIYEVARKHRILPEEISAFHAQIRSELNELEDGKGKLPLLDEQLRILESEYETLATRLSKERYIAVKDLEEKIHALLSSLGMKLCKIVFSLKKRDSLIPHPKGLEDMELLVSTNPGSAEQPLRKIASGGELSRISLAIQVASANTAAIPSIVFDEIDSGIGGAVAETVGKLLKQLSRHCQILCVTHLPQVTAFGNSHLFASKVVKDGTARASMTSLGKSERIDEIARMLAGTKVTDSAVANAKEMIELGQD